jgi:hypothetical protein
LGRGAAERVLKPASTQFQLTGEYFKTRRRFPVDKPSVTPFLGISMADTVTAPPLPFRHYI